MSGPIQRSAPPAGAPHQPRAMVHKQILDAVAAQPEAAMATIADEVTGATTGLVERVLDEYGDPGAAETSGGPPPVVGRTESAAVSEPHTVAMQDQQSAPERDPSVDVEDLTDKQRETLRVIHDHPDATQAKVAKLLDVSPPTISNRVDEIPGLTWGDRQAFVETLFDGASPTADGGEEGAARLDELATTVAALEDRLDALEADRGREDPPLSDPELVHKVVHASMTSERISEDEEFRILEALMR